MSSDAEGQGEEQAYVSDQWGQEAATLLQPHQLQHPAIRSQNGDGGGAR